MDKDVRYVSQKKSEKAKAKAPFTCVIKCAVTPLATLFKGEDQTGCMQTCARAQSARVPVQDQDDQG